MARRRRKRRSAKLILWAIVIFVAAGFLARRILAPSAIYYLTHRPPQHSSDLSVDKAVPPIDESQARPAPPAVSPRLPEPVAAASPEASAETPAAPEEDLNASDRRALDDVIRGKERGK
ncbi:MAG: hypothetical protein WA005_05430 [Candidatus Binataceae bacterium]